MPLYRFVAHRVCHARCGGVFVLLGSCVSFLLLPFSVFLACCVWGHAGDRGPTLTNRTHRGSLGCMTLLQRAHVEREAWQNRQMAQLRAEAKASEKDTRANLIRQRDEQVKRVSCVASMMRCMDLRTPVRVPDRRHSAPHGGVARRSLNGLTVRWRPRSTNSRQSTRNK